MDDLISRQELLKRTIYNPLHVLYISSQDVLDCPSAQPELIKDTIQKFHDYQVEWLTSHCDLELEPMLESWVVRFLHDTANCYMMEVDHATTEPYEDKHED